MDVVLLWMYRCPIIGDYTLIGPGDIYLLCACHSLNLSLDVKNKKKNFV